MRIICVVLVLLVCAGAALADGLMAKLGSYPDRMDFVDENRQLAYINYENGIEKMILSVSFDERESDSVVWLFPVPGAPADVKIDIIKDFPEIRGEDVVKRAKHDLDETKIYYPITQIYPFFCCYPAFLKTKSSSGAGGSVSSVSVYEHLEKEGITTEVITAGSAGDLYGYLKDRGLDIGSGALPVLDSYIGKNYTFVVSWITSPKKFDMAEFIKERFDDIAGDTYLTGKFPYKQKNIRFIKFNELLGEMGKKYPGFEDARFEGEYLETLGGMPVLSEMADLIEKNPSVLIGEDGVAATAAFNLRGVFVSFPTEDIYFPLIPTSVYGERVVPAEIRVIGHVTPKIFNDIREYTKVEHFVGRVKNYDSLSKDFYGRNTGNIRYTKIDMEAPSKFFTDDLWMKNKAPFRVRYSMFLTRNSVLVCVIIIILSSLMAGIIAGCIVFPYLRKKPLKLALIGLSNCLSIAGIIFAIMMTGTKERAEDTKALLAVIAGEGYIERRIIAAVLFFCAVLFLLFGLIVMPDLINRMFSYDQYFDGISRLLMVIAVFGLPGLFFIAGLVYKRVKPEHVPLFKRLKEAEISSWSFQPVDKTKGAFIAAFSVCFMLLTWLLVELVKLTV